MTWLNLVLLAVALQNGQVAPFEKCITGAAKTVWELPPEWREVSGMAMSADGRIFLHGDENGRIGVLDSRTGKMVGAFELGSTSPKGDFEDIVIVDQDLYLVTASGRLYRTPLPPAGQTSGSLPYSVFETRASKWCEIEGLEYDANDRILLLGCKQMLADEAMAPSLIRWSLDAQQLSKPEHIQLAASSEFQLPGLNRFRPSAMRIDPRSKRLVIVSSADSRVVVADRSGAVLASAAIPKSHKQPEGLVITEAGVVYLSDEGGKGLGSVSVYECR